MASVAEFERALIAERVRADMARAKAQGKPASWPWSAGSLRSRVPHWRSGLRGSRRRKEVSRAALRPRQPSRRSCSAKEIRCQLTGKRTYDRCVAVCYLDGADIEAIMVRTGYARDCPRYSGGRHREAERQAAADGATIGRIYALPGYCRTR